MEKSAAMQTWTHPADAIFTNHVISDEGRVFVSQPRRERSEHRGLREQWQPISDPLCHKATTMTSQPKDCERIALPDTSRPIPLVPASHEVTGFCGTRTCSDCINLQWPLSSVLRPQLFLIRNIQTYCSPHEHQGHRACNSFGRLFFNCDGNFAMLEPMPAKTSPGGHPTSQKAAAGSGQNLGNRIPLAIANHYSLQTHHLLPLKSFSSSSIMESHSWIMETTVKSTGPVIIQIIDSRQGYMSLLVFDLTVRLGWYG
ncbi:hypothetical protein E6O75_ATG02197 [Venturia nashicola]|uniref:Uncharacterized protein n=1 Tax=Venturia nashicola TaxID=86259 RepID=A0A4Z1P2U1_9PEZI|nr:hypothetical protein E6O75_ATG02197 [Venturia nashicola]